MIRTNSQQQDTVPSGLQSWEARPSSQRRCHNYRRITLFRLLTKDVISSHFVQPALFALSLSRAFSISKNTGTAPEHNRNPRRLISWGNRTCVTNGGRNSISTPRNVYVRNGKDDQFHVDTNSKPRAYHLANLVLGGALGIFILAYLVRCGNNPLRVSQRRITHPSTDVSIIVHKIVTIGQISLNDD